MQNEQIRNSLEKTIKEKKIVYFSGNNLDITFQTSIKALKNNEIVIENHVPPQYISRLCGSKEFSLLCSLLRFKTNKITSDGENIIFPFDGHLSMGDTRQAERFTFALEEKVFCEFLNPYDQETKLSKSVLDMSATGLSLRSMQESKLFSPGTRLSELKVLIDGNPYVQTTGEVVYQRKMIDLRGLLLMQVGIKFGSNVSIGGSSPSSPPISRA